MTIDSKRLESAISKMSTLEQSEMQLQDLIHSDDILVQQKMRAMLESDGTSVRRLSKNQLAKRVMSHTEQNSILSDTIRQGGYHADPASDYLLDVKELDQYAFGRMPVSSAIPAEAEAAAAAAAATLAADEEPEKDKLYDLDIVFEYKHNTVVYDKNETLRLPLKAKISGGATKEYDSKNRHVSKLGFSKLPLGDYTLELTIANLDKRPLKKSK